MDTKEVLVWSVTVMIFIGLGEAFHQLNIILVAVGQTPAYGYTTTIPVYFVAFDRLRQRYPHVFANISTHSLYLPGSFTCAAAADVMIPLAGKVGQILAELNGVTVILTPACSAEMMVLGDFAREWNVLTMSSTAGDQALANKVRYPTVVTCAPPDHPSISLAAQMFLQRYKWQTVAFFCDDLNQYPGLGSFFYLSCRNVKKLLETRLGQFSIYMYSFDTPAFSDFPSILTDVQSRSRVVIIFSIPKIVRQIMITAYRLNMTNGDYIFLSSRMARVPGEGKQTWKFNDSDDPIAFQAFRSLIYWEHPAAQWNQIMEVMDDVAAYARREYNLTFTLDDKLNDFSVSAYEMTSALAMVLNDSYDIPSAQLGGRELAKQFFNRSFSFPWRNVTIGSNGMRLGDVCFYRLNQTSGEMEEAWHFYAATKSLVKISPLADVWRSSFGPPLNEPLCGYLNNLCDTSDSTWIIVAGIVTGLVLLFVLFVVAAYRSYLRKKESDNPWWYLHSDHAGHQVVSQYTLDDAQSSAKPMPWLSKLSLYQNEIVWTECFPCPLSPSQICNVRLARQTLNSMRNLQHPNIARFYGVSRDGAKVSLLYEYGSRGNLRLLLSDESLPLDIDLQMALIREMASGLKYIHTSPLYFHGALSSLTVMVDNRFGIKLSDYGMTNVVSGLTDVHLGGTNDCLQLWMAPEMVTDDEYPGCRESDIYSFGVVMAEVFTRRMPLDVSLNDQLSIQDRLHMLKKSPSTQRIIVTPEEVPSYGEKLLRDCFLDNSDHRPSIRDLIQVLNGKNTRKLSGLGRTAASVVDCIISRLERYSSELEKRIAERTVELVREEEKVNELLRDILPESIVRKLRNKLPMEAEDFDDASILFTHFPEFALVCSQSQPLFIIRLLHHIYTLLDGLMEQHDVYKVETIGDSYMVVSGVPVRNGAYRHAGESGNLALRMLAAVQPMSSMVLTGVDFQLRLGMHSGPCAAGIVGNRMPRYCLFGDTINTASRMESHGEGGKIHISQSSNQILNKIGGYKTESRGLIEIKSKGRIETFWLLSKNS
ncbi:atrial natriuretic peptide receptor 1-like [Paramacrobiotus metropolitanus]|uniref:atrial natriuretic peptide receptor 1-like n=1 Tax=Paramacrobiotus metropolitanus TaxID=2943436 RepID=UPI0024464FAF|nr:atrial natriuretic peptide receptor 1-like [Paramacrobiotus metropolitanus]